VQLQTKWIPVCLLAPFRQALHRECASQRWNGRRQLQVHVWAHHDKGMWVSCVATVVCKCLRMNDDNYKFKLFELSRDLAWPLVISRDLSWPLVISRDLSWPLVISRDLLWPLVTSRDLLWSLVTSWDLSWPLVISRDLSWPLVISRDLSWSLVISCDLSWPLVTSRDKGVLYAGLPWCAYV